MSWVLLAILSALFAALVAVFGKIGLKAIDPTIATTVRVTIMTAFFIVVSASLGKFKLLSSIDNRALTFIVLSGLAGALSWLCYFAAMKLGTASAVSALDRLSIVFIVIMGVIFLGETLTIKTGIGALLVALGALLFVL